MKTKSLTKVTLLTLVVMSAITAVTLNSCQKENVKPKVITASKGKNPIESANIMDEVNSILFSSVTKQKGLLPNFHGFDSSACANIVSDTISKPHTLTYTYSSSCTGNDGHVRSGTVKITYDNIDPTEVNNTYVISLQNFTLDSTLFNGSVNMLNTGYNNNGNIVLTIGGTVTSTTGTNVVTGGVNYSYEWIGGQNSSPLANVQVSITGSARATSNSGDSVILTITSPLIQNFLTPGCNFYIQGTTHMIDDGETKDIDYGTPGGCSGQMQVTKNGITSIKHQ